MIIMKNKKNKKSCVILTICGIIFICNILVATQPTSNNQDVSTIMLREKVERQEKLLSADYIVKKAYQAYIDKKFDIAHDQYLKGIKLLESISSQNKDIKMKLNKLKDALALVYTYWAQDILDKSEIATDSKKFDEAIELCRKAAEIDPKLKNKSEKLISNIEKKKAYSNYKYKISDKDVEINYKKRAYNTDVLYAQGKKLYFDKKYTEAKEKLKGLLVIDPYNAKAIQYLKLTNNKIASAGLNRSDVTFIKRQAESEWENLTPIIAKTLSGERVDIAEINEPILKLNDNESIKKKLDDIMISHIAFEEVPITTAMLFLKSESKRLDPEGKGINIFLKLESKNEVDENIDEENADDVGDDEWEDEWEDEDFEDSSDGDEKMDDFADQYLVTIVLNNVPLGTVIDYLCRATGLKYRISKYAIEVYTPGTGFDEMEIKVIPIEKDLFEELLIKENSAAASDMKSYFKNRGIQFPGGATAVYDTKISRLIVRNTPEQISNIVELITKLNSDAPQVSILAKFVEMQQKDFEELGFEWRLSTTDQANKVTLENNDQINRFALVENQNAAASNSLDRAFGAYIEKGGIRLDSVIHALDKNEQIEVLSAPRVTTINGQTAVIKMVTYSYYPVSWSEGTITTKTNDLAESDITVIPPAPVFEEPTPEGIILSVIPTIRSDNYTIDLEMEPEVQTFDGWSDYTYTAIVEGVARDFTLKMPKFKVRTIQTHLRVFDGETVVMGGVIRDVTDTTDDRIPIMGDIPLIGRFFRSEIEDVDKTNLLIFAKIKLVKPDGTSLRSEYNEGLPSFDK